MKPIYIIVEVTYDHYRFQDNLGATTDIEEARAFARKYSDDRDCSVIEGETASKLCDRPETHHIWIQTIS